MNYTPYINHTIDELLDVVKNKQDLTDLEVELADRVVTLQTTIDALEDELAEMEGFKRKVAA